MRAPRIVALLSVALIIAAILATPSETQGEAQLVVSVIDSDGERREGIEVILVNETYRARFVTDREGQAIFRFLDEGTYELSVTIDGVRVASRSVDYPSESSVELILKMGSMRLLVSDLGGRPIGGINVTLRASAGGVVKWAITGNDGVALIKDVPYSELEGVGDYLLSGRLGEVEVLNGSLSFPAVEEEARLTAYLADISFRLLNLEGMAIASGRVRLVSPGFESEAEVEEGVARVSTLPTSQVVGKYSLEVLMRYPGGPGDILVYRRGLEISGYTNETIVLDLGRLVIRVADDAENPLPNLKVNLRSAKHGLVSTQITDGAGRAEFIDIPLSRGELGAGEYTAELLKRDIEISRLHLSLLSQREEINHTVERTEFSILLTKPNGEPLGGATISLRDPVTGRSVEAVADPSGRAVVSALPGLHSYSVSFLDAVVARGLIELSGGENALEVSGIDIEIRLRVVDWAGAPVDTAQPILHRGSQRIPLKKIDVGTYSAVVPTAGEVRVDLVREGELLQRRVFVITEQTELTLRLRSFSLGGALIEVETVMLILSSIFLALSIAIFPVLYLRRRGRSRSI